MSATDKPADPHWVDDQGNAISCVEKLRVLRENLAEIRQVCQDAFEDALLMGCSEAQLRAIFQQVVAELENPYRKG